MTEREAAASARPLPPLPHPAAPTHFKGPLFTAEQMRAYVLADRASERNQCDGCMQGAPLRGDLHIDKDGHAFMVCQKDRYAVLADRAAQPVRMLTAAECHAVRDEAFPNEPAPLVGFAQAVIRKFCEVNGIVPLAPAQTKEET